MINLSDAELLARLVAFDSTSRNSNLPIADFLCDYLDRPGVRLVRTAINVVPDRCTVELGLRALPGVDSRQLVERVERTVREAAPPFTPEVEVLTDSPPLLAAEDAPLVRALPAMAGQRESGAVSFATDAGWLQGLGMDCVLFGPGSIEAAHRPNEHLPKADLRAARTVLERAIEQFCVAAR